MSVSKPVEKSATETQASPRVKTHEERQTATEIAFLQALHLRLPKNERIIPPLSDLLIRNGKYREGLSVDQQLVRLRPTDPQAWYQLGCSFAMLNRPDDAIQALVMAIDYGYRDINTMLKDPDLKPLQQNLNFLALVGRTSMNKRIQVVLGDISDLSGCSSSAGSSGIEVDAVVNAANNTLLGGGGVDGAIHEAAGPELLKECLTLNGCETGDAKITQGYGLDVPYIIHTVGPVWKGGHQREDELLAQCYQRCLEVAEAHGVKTLAFPAISTGAYRYPLDRAVNIAVDTIVKNLARAQTFDRITFVCYDRDTYNCYVEKLKQKI